MGRLDHIVFDEADTLFDDSFSALSIKLIQKMKVCSAASFEAQALSIKLI